MKVKPESTFTQPTDICPHPEYWHSQDCEATEAEVVELIGSLIRALQPECVVETGTYKGDMAEAIGRSLKKNGHGRLITFEVDPSLYKVSRRRCRGLPVDLRLQSSLEWEPTGPIDFCWLDSGIETRIHEFQKYYPHLKGAIVAIHDTAPHHPVRAEIEKHILSQLSPIWLPTPRGVMIGQVL